QGGGCMSQERRGERFGAHRVIEPKGALPQPAQRLDASFDVLWDNEVVVDVETLNVDAASFRQMEEASGGSPDGVVALVRRTVEVRGKQHNPVTDSGGMLLGVVSHIGNAARKRCEEINVGVGDRVATLASLSLTPLRLDEVL